MSAEPTRLETLTSLRRRGLLSADGYRLHAEALALPSVAPRPLWLHPFAVFIAVLGCVAAMPGVVFQELQAGLLAAFVGAPVIEEALKPTGIYILMLRWPRALQGRMHTAFLGAVAGLTFGLIESYLYVSFYYPDEGDDYVLFRFTVPVLMHVLASAIVGYGLSRAIIDWAAGREPFPKLTRNCYFAAVGLHALYNITAVALSVSGHLDFD